MEHIFDPFYTTKGLANRDGLSLAMAYGVVKNHSGLIECSSELGLGTTFKIYLPAIEHYVKPDKEAEVEVCQGGTETILLVDDEECIRSLGENLLNRYGYTVHTAPDGESALELYRKEQKRIHLIVLDLIMPGMGGRRCLEELININPEVKVIVISGYSDAGSMKESIEARAKRFIGKPYKDVEMLQIVREVLDVG